MNWLEIMWNSIYHTLHSFNSNVIDSNYVGGFIVLFLFFFSDSFNSLDEIILVVVFLQSTFHDPGIAAVHFLPPCAVWTLLPFATFSPETAAVFVKL